MIGTAIVRGFERFEQGMSNFHGAILIVNIPTRESTSIHDGVKDNDIWFEMLNSLVIKGVHLHEQISGSVGLSRISAFGPCLDNGTIRYNVRPHIVISRLVQPLHGIEEALGFVGGTFGSGHAPSPNDGVEGTAIGFHVFVFAAHVEMLHMQKYFFCSLGSMFVVTLCPSVDDRIIGDCVRRAILASWYFAFCFHFCEKFVGTVGIVMSPISFEDSIEGVEIRPVFVPTSVLVVLFHTMKYFFRIFSRMFIIRFAPSHNGCTIGSSRWLNTSVSLLVLLYHCIKICLCLGRSVRCRGDTICLKERIIGVAVGLCIDISFGSIKPKHPVKEFLSHLPSIPASTPPDGIDDFGIRSYSGSYIEFGFPIRKLFHTTQKGNGVVKPFLFVGIRPSVNEKVKCKSIHHHVALGCFSYCALSVYSKSRRFIFIDLVRNV
mmetsp:Transcript_40548/g.60102  ORF Transcript_40548/g.60102 Transcript_40548/m.60102 type:complete len:433 (-) Transcript_40548:404-1702(-)